MEQSVWSSLSDLCANYMANKLSLHSTLSLSKPCKHCDVIEDKLYVVITVSSVTSFQYKIYLKKSEAKFE